MIEALYPNLLADHNWIPNTRERDTPTMDRHASDHNKYAAEIVAIERELGTNPAADYSDVSTRLDDFEFRINSLEGTTDNNYVTRTGDTMTGLLTVPEFIIGNISNSLEGIRFTQKGYIRPLENFTGDAFKVQTINGETLFEVPFSGGDVKLRNGAVIYHSANHIHRTDVQNDERYIIQGTDLGRRIILSAVKERYKEFTIGADGTTTLTLDADDANHFKIRTLGASVNVNIVGIPTSAFRNGITIALQNLGTTPALLTILNSNTWADSGTTPDLTTNGGRDTEIFAYTIGEGDRWMLHQYYVNKAVRLLGAAYPTAMTHHFKFYGRGAASPAFITDEKTTAKMYFSGSASHTLEGVQITNTGGKYVFSDTLDGLTLQNNVAIISVVKNISTIQEFAALAAIASSVKATNYLRGDKLSNNRLRARLSSSTGSFDVGTDNTPISVIGSGTESWTMIAAVKTADTFGVYNMNTFAKGGAEEDYFASKPITAGTVFDAAGNMRAGVGIVPRSDYSASPTGIGTFICAATLILEGSWTQVDLMQAYRAVRQDMLGLGLSSLPAPTI